MALTCELLWFLLLHTHNGQVNKTTASRASSSISRGRADLGVCCVAVVSTVALNHGIYHDCCRIRAALLGAEPAALEEKVDTSSIEAIAAVKYVLHNLALYLLVCKCWRQPRLGFVRTPPFQQGLTPAANV